MAPAAILALALPLLERLGLAAAAAAVDALEVTDEERADRVEQLLDRAEKKARRARDRGALGQHRTALRAWRQAQALQDKARRKGAALFAPPTLLVPEP